MERVCYVCVCVSLVMTPSFFFPPAPRLMLLAANLLLPLLLDCRWVGPWRVCIGLQTACQTWKTDGWAACGQQKRDGR